MKLLRLTQIFTLVSVHALSLLSAEDASEPRSQWFQDAKFGMFTHWGLYSQLGGTWNGHTLPAPSLPNGNGPYSEWAQMRLEIPKEEYQKRRLPNCSTATIRTFSGSTLGAMPPRIRSLRRNETN